MSDPPTAMRERFEKWAKTPRENEWHWEEWAFERGASGEYLGASVDSAWAAWQASLPSEAGIEAVARRIAERWEGRVEPRKLRQDWVAAILRKALRGGK